MTTQINRIETIRQAAANLKRIGLDVSQSSKKTGAGDAFEEDSIHYSDANKYAEEFYGEVYRETTRHDNFIDDDWGAY